MGWGRRGWRGEKGKREREKGETGWGGGVLRDGLIRK